MDLDEFAPVLGAPLRPADTSVLEALQALWGVELPVGFLQVLTAYGDSTIAGFLILYGPRTLGFVGENDGPGLADWEILDDQDSIPIRPSPDGLVLWGSTAEGDELCLKQIDDRWIVAASLRHYFEWRDYDLEFTDWLHQVLTGRICEDWMPELQLPLPLPIAEFGRNPFATTMGSGPAGASL